MTVPIDHSIETADIETGSVATAIAHHRRVVPLSGVFNFRDIGGYPALGGVTRWESVYRADGLSRLTTDDLGVLRDRGLGVVIDLRTEAELDERGRFPVDQHTVRFHHLPVLDRTWLPGDMPVFDNAADFLLWAYHDMIKVGSDKLAAGLTLIAESGDLPVVFHCAAGKDRTGLLAALLLSVLGVPAEFIAADYGKTEDGMRRMRQAWMEAVEAETPGDSSRVADAPAYYFACPPEVMHTFLADLAAEHGSVVDFVRGLGVSDATIAALRRRLIEPLAAASAAEPVAAS